MRGTAPRAGRPLPATLRRRLLSVLRALGDGTRLEVFRMVASGRGPVCVCRIVERFRVSQPTVSHHLRVLREAGLVTVAKRGTWSWYAPAPRGLAVLSILRRPSARPRARRRRKESRP